ncbi:putative selenate ABC transporter substrate-binding protein [Hyalangium versicolor]|uniref:putative selenate ABC transporter substrate-binding protein n=1 Tax=Hyalangium versicolor TaxID=2861190 RepID=UPI001CCDBADB|nr:putative selenate ABC transporter substrate-binding protein [Hyalangium versicolor]
MMAKLGVCLAVCLVLLANPARAADEAPVLRVSMVPEEPPAELQRKLAPLMAYLEKATGRKVQFIPATTYQATIDGLANKQLDMVWYGGLTFVEARRRTGNAIPLIQRVEDATFHSKFVVPANSPAKTLMDLKGTQFAFGPATSTSGHLMPRYFLMQAGIDPERDFKKVIYSGAHDVTARWVETGKVDAGVLNELVFQRLLNEKKIDPAKIRVLWTSPAYFNYNWTVRGDLEPELVEKIRAAFLALDASKPEHKVILDSQQTKKFIETKVENYQSIEAAAKATKLIAD